jgi:hypothetical protein
MNAGTHVLMSLRDFQKDKGDIIFVYKDSELDYLKQNNYISVLKDSVESNLDFSKENDNNNDPGFEFSDI